MSATNVVRHHFDLSHFTGELPDLQLHVGMTQFPVGRHNHDSLAQAARDNAVIGAMTAPQRSLRITHFADVPASTFPERQIKRLKLTYDDGDRRFRLRSVAWYGMYIPPQYRQRQRTLALSASALVQPPKLRELGLRPLAGRELTTLAHVKLLADADLVGTPTDTATALVGRHPQLASTFAPSAARLETHINAGNNATALLQLAFHIRQNPTTWQIKEQPVDPTTNQPYVFEYPLGPHQAGDPVEQYALSDATVSKMGAAMIAPINSANNDLQLRNQSWSVAHGRPVYHGAANRAARRAARATLRADDVTWSLSMASLPTSWGLSADPDSIGYDGSDVSINVTNHIQRTVGAYVEFFDPSGQAIEPPNWTSRLGAGLESLETATTKYLQPIGPQVVVMGIPLWNTTDKLSFPWPEQASSAQLTFGSMGASDWTKPCSIAGAVLTGVFNFGFPALFMASGVFSGDGSSFTEIIEGPSGLIIVAMGVTIVVALIVGGAGLDDESQVLTTFGGIVAGMLVKQALAAAMAGILSMITGDEVADCIPIVGQFLRAAAAIGYGVQLAEATCEVFRAPATMTLTLSRSFTLTVGVTPDPRHGLPGKPQTAVWPALSHSYEVTVQYRGGASWKQTGRMPRSETGTPLNLTFDAMPAGSSLQVVVAIKSSDGWLCGTWTSDWQLALPSDASNTLAVNGHITEQLAPLTADATYSWNQSIVYSPTGGASGTGGHVWAYDAAPTATIASLGTGTQIGLGALVGLTILEKMYAAGYVWMGFPLNPNAGGTGAPAAAQAYCYQGLSLIGDPDSQLVLPNSVTAEQSSVFYEKFGPVPQPATQPPYNYFLDPSTGTLNLTFIDLSGYPPGPLTLQPPASTWGSFPVLKSLDDVVVHPSGYVVGISSTTHKLLSLTLPKAAGAAATGSALAQMSSNRGTRQGLVDTPVALDICPDGTILVLEQGNQRVQAFDAHANPVPTFDEKLLFTAAGDGITGALDQEKLPATLQALFISNGVNRLFSLPASVSGDLTPGTANQALRDAFQDESTLLSTTSTVAAGASTGQWTIVDPQTTQSYAVVANSTSGGFDVFHIFGSDATVTARVPGARWVISDPAGAAAYDIKIDAGDSSKIDVYNFVSTFPLAATADGTAAVCLDIAVEPTGYAYVLTHTGKGDQISDFALDIYTAEGAFLNRTGSVPGATTGFVGAKIAVDIWRNLFTLDYQVTVGPHGQSEPQISQWVPTPPAGTLPQSCSADFLAGNVAQVMADLQTAGVSPLASTITIKQVSAAGHWQVIGPPSYDVILSAASTQPIGGSTAPGAPLLYVYPLAGP
jgi:hypothetical protein